MKELIPMDEYGVFADKRDTARVNSLFVAKYFNKEHNKVLRDIRELDCSDDFRLSNFGQSSYTNEQGKKQPCYDMTRDGFVFLVMGYRGKKAARFKEAYIKRFNEMERHIATLVSVRTDYPILTDAVKMAHENPKPYHFSNEADLLNRIITGCTAKQFREGNGIPKGESIRPYLTPAQIELMDVMQKVDTGLLISTPDFQQRKRLLEWYKGKYVEKLLSA